MDQKKIREIAEKFIGFFDKNAVVVLSQNEGNWVIKVSSEDPGQLIGKMGETLNCLQYVLRMMVAKTAGEKVPLTIDIDGYKEKKVNDLQELAVYVAKNVAASGFAQEMRPMNAYERRIVHTALADMKDIKVFSVGEGAERRIKIEKAN